MQIQKYKYAIPVLIILGTGVLAACSGSSSKKESDKPQEETKVKTAKPDNLMLTGAQMKNVGIEVGTIPQKNLDAVIKANGQLAVPPQNKADVSILSGGVIGRSRVAPARRRRLAIVLRCRR